MSQIAELAPPLSFGASPVPRGRPTKFTPERIRQISNLVERGKSREEIAELIGVTVGTLQVTCSKMGISLRRPRYDTGTGLLRQRRPAANGRISTPSPEGGEPQPSTGISASNSINVELLPKPNSPQVEDVKVGAPRPDRAKLHEQLASFVVTMRYKGWERTTEVPLTHDMIGQLAVEAGLRDMRIGELVSQVILEVTKNDLFQQVLRKTTMVPMNQDRRASNQGDGDSRCAA